MLRSRTAAAALAKAGDNSRLNTVLQLLFFRDAAYYALELVKWLGEDVGLAEAEMKSRAFRMMWKIARESNISVERNLALECLSYLPKPPEEAADLASIAKAQYLAKPSLQNARLLACVAMEYKDLKPLLEPLEQYSDGKLFSSRADKWLSLTWTAPVASFVTGLMAAAIGTAIGIFTVHSDQVVLPMYIFAGLNAMLSLAYFKVTRARSVLLKKSKDSLKALADVHKAALASQVLQDAKKFIHLPGDPSLDRLWDKALKALGIPATALFFSTTLRFEANSAVRTAILDLAESYRSKFASCRVHAKELAQKMADILTEPFFAKWANRFVLPMKLIGAFGGGHVKGPYEPMLKRLQESFGAGIMLDTPEEKIIKETL